MYSYMMVQSFVLYDGLLADSVVWGFIFNNYQDTVNYFYINIIIDTTNILDEYSGL
jgi:hypothetical protein